MVEKEETITIKSKIAKSAKRRHYLTHYQTTNFRLSQTKSNS